MSQWPLEKISPNYVAQIGQSTDPNGLNLLVEDAMDWAHCHGLVIRTKEHKDRSDVCQVAPFALFPSPFPRRLFDQAMTVQEAMNLLYFRISWDFEFLVQAHRDVIPSDAFTRKMMDILVELYKEDGGVRQPITLLTQRADYMCHVKEGNGDEGEQQQYELKQIEVNNIAVSMGGLAERASVLHCRMLRKAGAGGVEKMVPENKPIATLAKGIQIAWQQFGDPNGLVLVVIGEVNQNQFDQRYMEYELDRLFEGRVKIVRLTLAQCAERLQLGTDDSALRLNGQPVAIVYFRTGYAPEDYPSDKEWEARRTIERSTAIKCPWIGLQLANTKKVQQVLDLPGSVERFFPDPKDAGTVATIRHTFAGMWGLELAEQDAEIKRVVQDALARPERYVLKPQLEGGGDIFFGQELVDKLRTLSPAELAAHILMQKIQPLVVQNYLIRAFAPVQLSRVVSELGIYGCLVGRGGAELYVQHNRAHGNILRTKAEHEKKGGVAVGAAVVDTACLF